MEANLKLWILGMALSAQLLPGAAIPSLGSAQASQALVASGREAYLSADFGRALRQFQKAVSATPTHAAAHNWLGKTYSARATVTAPLVGGKDLERACLALERAVSLEPGNLGYHKDLLEASLERAELSGAGWERASAVAERISALDRFEGEQAQWLLAESRRASARGVARLNRPVNFAGNAISKVGR